LEVKVAKSTFGILPGSDITFDESIRATLWWFDELLLLHWLNAVEHFAWLDWHALKFNTYPSSSLGRQARHR
jgi:hypothetical protein